VTGRSAGRRSTPLTDRTKNGTSIVDVTDPKKPEVSSISPWRTVRGVVSRCPRVRRQHAAIHDKQGTCCGAYADSAHEIWDVTNRATRCRSHRRGGQPRHQRSHRDAQELVGMRLGDRVGRWPARRPTPRRDGGRAPQSWSSTSATQRTPCSSGTGRSTGSSRAACPPPKLHKAAFPQYLAWASICSSHRSASTTRTVPLRADEIGPKRWTTLEAENRS